MPMPNLLQRLRRDGLRRVVASGLMLVFLMQCAVSAAPMPAWWARQNVLSSENGRDDYTVANVGQLKMIARKAAEEMGLALSLSGGAGDDISLMISQWDSALLDEVVGDDYTAVNVGMLKHVASKFYDRLREHHNDPVLAPYAYPWSVVKKTGVSATTGSAVLTLPATTGLAAGMPVYGPGIPEGAVVDSFRGTTELVLSAAATANGSDLVCLFTKPGVGTKKSDVATVAGSDMLTLAATTGLGVGMTVFGPGLPERTHVLKIQDATHVILSQPAAASGTGQQCVFYAVDDYALVNLGQLKNVFSFGMVPNGDNPAYVMPATMTLTRASPSPLRQYLNQGSAGLRVRLLYGGEGLSGVYVTFQVPAGQGYVSPFYGGGDPGDITMVATDSEGYAVAKFEGSQKGLATVTASTTAVTSKVTFSIRVDPEYGTDGTDLDSDGDYLTDYEEINIFHTDPHKAITRQDDGQTVLDGYLYLGMDSDADGLPDLVEKSYHGSESWWSLALLDGNGDMDDDGYTDRQAYEFGWRLDEHTDTTDTDDDGIRDSLENFWMQKYPGSLNKNIFADAVLDFDGDGVLNFEETSLGLDPGSAHSRSAQVHDLEEWCWRKVVRAVPGSYGLPPWAQYPGAEIPPAWMVLMDDDSSGVPDGLEAFAMAVKSDPALATLLPHSIAPGDYDGDGLPDVYEHRLRNYVYDSSTLFSQSLRDPNDATANPDNDRINTLAEYQRGRNPYLADDPPFEIATMWLPVAYWGEHYEATIVVVGAEPPRRDFVISGQLPDGLTFNPATGVISGIPTTSIDPPPTDYTYFGFAVSVTDGFNVTTTRQLQIDACARPEGEPGAGTTGGGTVEAIQLLTDNEALAINSDILERNGYAVALNSSGGTTADAMYEVAGLPAWLVYDPILKSITSQGASTFPDYSLNVYDITIRVLRGSERSFPLKIEVREPFIFTRGELPSGRSGSPYTTLLGADDTSGGVGQITYSVLSATSAAGTAETFTITGNTLTGTPLGEGRHKIELRATDSRHRTVSKTFTLWAEAATAGIETGTVTNTGGVNVISGGTGGTEGTGGTGGTGTPINDPDPLLGSGFGEGASFSGGEGSYTWEIEGTTTPYEILNGMIFFNPIHPGTPGEFVYREATVTVTDDAGNVVTVSLLVREFVPTGSSGSVPGGPTEGRQGDEPDPGNYYPASTPPDPVPPAKIVPNDNAGPRYRKVGLNGSPLPDAKPQVKDESGENPEETYVDAYTRELRHSVTDVYASVDSSLLPLMVRRDVLDEVWNEDDGYLPEGMPDRPFGHGWSSNLVACVKLSEDGRTAVVTDEQGSTQTFYREDFLVNGLLVDFEWKTSAEEKNNSKTRWNKLRETMENNERTFIYTKMYGTTCKYRFALTQGVPGSLPTGTTGAASVDKYHYSRLVEVTDRLGNSLVYEYPPPHPATHQHTLIPSRIFDPKRLGTPGAPNRRPHQISIEHSSDRKRVTKVMGPGGEITEYTYQDVSAGNESRLTKLNTVTRLGSATQPATAVNYRYSVVKEPAGPGYPTTLSWHAAVDQITDERGNAYTFTLDFNRHVQYLNNTPSESTWRVRRGIPRVVDVVTLPGSTSATPLTTTFNGVRNGAVVAPMPYTVYSVTTVDGPAGKTTYLFTQPYVQVPKHHGPVGLTFLRMDIFPDVISTVPIDLAYSPRETYIFDEKNGMGLKTTYDMDYATTSYSYEGGYDDPVTETNAIINHQMAQNPSAPTPTTGIKKFAYDSGTRVMKSVTDELGVVTETEVQLGTGLRLKEEVREPADSNGIPGKVVKRTLFRYDNTTFRGFMTQQTVSALTTADGVGTEGAAYFKDIVTRYMPDDHGRVWKEIVDPAGVASTTLYEYDGNGNKTRVTDPLGRSTYFTYDVHHRLVSTAFPDGSTKELVYDAHGNVIKEVNENKVPVFHEYDKLNRRVKTTLDLKGNGQADTARATDVAFTGSGIDETPVYNGDMVTSMTYNGRNQVVTQTDPRGKVTTNTYDGLGRLTSTDDQGLITSYEYGLFSGGGLFDTSGFKPTKITDPSLNVTTITYDRMHRPLTSTVAYAPGMPTSSGAASAAVAQAHAVVTARLADREAAAHEVALAAEKLQTPAEAGAAVALAQTARSDAQDVVDDLNEDLDDLEDDYATAEGLRAAAAAVPATIELRQPLTDAEAALVTAKTIRDNSKSSHDWLLLQGADTTEAYNIWQTDEAIYNSAVLDEAAARLSFEATPAGADLAAKTTAANIAAAAVADALLVLEDAEDAAVLLQAELDHAEGVEADVLAAAADPALKAQFVAAHAARAATLAAKTSLHADATAAEARAQKVGDTLASFGSAFGPSLFAPAVTTTTYDAKGNPVSVTDPLGRTTLTKYDFLGQVIEVIEPDTTPTDLTNNPRVRSSHTSFGKPWKVIDQMGNTVTTQYDAAGRPVEVRASPVPGTSATTSTTYDAAGNVTEVTDPLGRKTTTAYDSRNRPLQVKSPPVFDAASGQTVRPVVSTTYDALGQPLTVTDPMGAVTTTTYDRAGRAWKVQAPAPGTGSGASRPTTRTAFDAGGLALRVTNPLGQTITNTYDIHGRLTQTVDAAAITNVFGYDAAGNRTLVRDGKNQETTFVYDGLKRLVGQTFANGDVWTHLHNSVQKIKQASPRGIVTTYEYDPRDRLMSVTAPAHVASGTPALRRVHTYDNAGKLLTVTENNDGTSPANVSYTYDGMGRMLSESSRGKTHQYVYDLAGNRTQATYSTTRVVDTTYDALNRPATITEGGRTTTYGYDQAGRALSLVGGNGQTSRNQYDALGRLKSRILYQGGTSSTVLARFTWEHDLLGNVLAQHESWPGQAGRPSGIRSTRMAYDDNNRLLEETIQTRTTESATPVDQSTTLYTYDAANNRATKWAQRIAGAASSAEAGENEVGYWELTYNAANQLTRWEKLDEPSGSSLKVATLTYDDAGNRTGESVLTQGVSSPAVKTFTWDAQDRLLGVTLPDGSTHAYEYDYRTRRIGTSTTTTAPAVTKQTAIVFSGGLSVAEWESSTGSLPVSPTVEYTRGPDMGGGVGGLLYSLRTESGATISTAKYNLSNGRGDIVAQSNQSAALTWTASYEAYGKRTKETGTNQDKQRGNSKDEDPTGLLNEGMRYRDLETGVWMSRDPAGFVDGPNLYAYVRQNPWTSFDPDGLAEMTHYRPNKDGKGFRRLEADPNDRGKPLTSMVDGKECVEVHHYDTNPTLHHWTGYKGKSTHTTWEPAADYGYGSPVSTAKGNASKNEFQWKNFNPSTNPVANMQAIGEGASIPLVKGLNNTIQTAYTQVTHQFTGGKILGLGLAAIRRAADAIKTVDLYRAVGVREFNSVMGSGQFIPAANSLEGRQFAMTLKEALKYADADPTKAAILKVTIPKKVLPSFDFSKAIDPHIFKNGVITVQPGTQSEIFHKSLIGPVNHAF